jgi:hypothetical protein
MDITFPRVLSRLESLATVVAALTGKDVLPMTYGKQIFTYIK